MVILIEQLFQQICEKWFYIMLDTLTSVCASRQKPKTRVKSFYQVGLWVSNPYILIYQRVDILDLIAIILNNHSLSTLQHSPFTAHRKIFTNVSSCGTYSLYVRQVFYVPTLLLLSSRDVPTNLRNLKSASLLRSSTDKSLRQPLEGRQYRTGLSSSYFLSIICLLP